MNMDRDKGSEGNKAERSRASHGGVGRGRGSEGWRHLKAGVGHKAGKCTGSEVGKGVVGLRVGKEATVADK